MYETPELKVEDKKPKIKPFNAYFANRILKGKSEVRVGLPHGIRKQN